MKEKLSRINNIEKPKYKVEVVYAELECNKPIIKLKSKYLNKTKHFCQQCTLELFHLELAEEISKGDV